MWHHASTYLSRVQSSPPSLVPQSGVPFTSCHLLPIVVLPQLRKMEMKSKEERHCEGGRNHEEEAGQMVKNRYLRPGPNGTYIDMHVIKWVSRLLRRLIHVRRASNMCLCLLSTSRCSFGICQVKSVFVKSVYPSWSPPIWFFTKACVIASDTVTTFFGV